MKQPLNPFDEAAGQVVDLANRLADEDQDASLWDIADGLLAGALHYWLYVRQPCGDPRCEDCAETATAEQRLAVLQRLTEQLARDSEYFHAPTDLNVGRA
ncbi:hypothetical protein HUS23_11805 [Ectothiorhodospiraceae bacterium 2226]|nr:hypothetical protein HUS23_11805 [Ectothiorhodospiraceae bacterium 2226]